MATSSGKSSTAVRSNLFGLGAEIVLLAGLVIPAANANCQVPQSSNQPPIPTWTDEIAKNYLPYHQLKVEEFAIKDKSHPQTAYWLQPFVHYYCHFMASTAPGGMVYANITDWTVFSGFDKNQSCRNSKFRESDMRAQLPYVQAILDINEIHARKFAALQAGELPSGSGRTFEEARGQLAARLSGLYQTIGWEAQKEIFAFEKETNNGQDKKKVLAVAAEIKKRLGPISANNGANLNSPAPAASRFP